MCWKCYRKLLNDQLFKTAQYKYHSDFTKNPFKKMNIRKLNSWGLSKRHFFILLYSYQIFNDTNPLWEMIHPAIIMIIPGKMSNVKFHKSVFLNRVCHVWKHILIAHNDLYVNISYRYMRYANHWPKCNQNISIIFIFYKQFTL